MAMRKPNDTWRIPQIICKNTPGHSLLRPSRIAVTCIMHGGSRRMPTYNLNLGRRRALSYLDTIKGGGSNPQDGAYAMRYRMETMKSLGPLTGAVDLLFQIVDKRTRDDYRAAFDLLSPGATVYTTKTANEELFPLRAILINSLTEEHTDSGDWDPANKPHPGRIVVSTRTVKLHWAALLLESFAAHCTTVEPIPNTEPEGGAQTTAGVSQLSLALIG